MHKNTIKSILAVIACCVVTAGQAQTPPPARQPPPPAPGAGAPAIDRTAEQLAAALKASMAERDPATAPIAVNDQYYMNVVHRSKVSGGGAHPGWTELHYIVSGGGTFVTGGTMKKVGDLNTIDGGVSRKVKPGDAIVVPQGTNHWYSEVNDLVYLEIRFIAPVTPAK